MIQGDLFAAPPAPAAPGKPTGHVPVTWWPSMTPGKDVAACTRCSGVLYRAAGDPAAPLEELDAHAGELRPARPCTPRPVGARVSIERDGYSARNNRRGVG